MKSKNTGVYGQIERFFIENPDEILLIEDICLKWDLTRKQARDAVSHIKRRGGNIKTVGNEVRGVWA